MNKRLVTTLMFIPLMVLTLMACESATQPGPGMQFAYPTFTPSPLSDSNQEAAYAAAQATLAAGQSQMMELARQATVINMNMEQAANASLQTTLDYNQLQLMELSIQGTEVSQNMAQAAATQRFIAEQTLIVLNATATVQSWAATQEFIIEQTQIAWNAEGTAQSQVATQQVIAEQAQIASDATAVAQSYAATQQVIAEQAQIAWNATATAQSQAATATYAAYVFNVTQAAQAQAILDVQAAQTAQANATQVAYSLTATPFAALQAEIVRARNESDRRALWGEFVVTPLTVILITLVIVLLIMGGVLAYRRFMPVLELRLRTIITRSNESSMLLVDGMIVDPDPLHHQLGQQELSLLSPAQLPSDDTPPVDIIGPSEPSITNWITEAEQKLRSEDWINA